MWMQTFEPKPYKNYKWIVADPRLLGGDLAIRGTRLSVALILECFANGMTLDDIEESFDRTFPRESIAEVFTVASELAGAAHVAA
jgi:uncharacterized protein (DUF433 family)